MTIISGGGEDIMSYTPNIAIHPGRVIARELDFLGMTQKMLSERTGLSEKQLSLIIHGEASVTAETATLLSNAIGGSAEYWSNLDALYRTVIARDQMHKRAESEVELVRTEDFLLAYRELAKYGYIERTKDPVTKVLNLWNFFGVNSLNAIGKTEATAFRKSAGQKTNPIALAAWVRCGELKARKKQVMEYDESKLKDSFSNIKKIIYNMPNDFFEQIANVLSDCGVILIACPHFLGTYVNGATKWVGGNPIIQVSMRGKMADKLWFTLFHEIGHILKHGKKGQISCDNDNSAQEQEANDFAAEILLPKKEYDAFRYKGDYSCNAILEFAKSKEIDPGVIVGRLQYDRYIQYNQLNHLHKQLKWKD